MSFNFSSTRLKDIRKSFNSNFPKPSSQFVTSLNRGGEVQNISQHHHQLMMNTSSISVERAEKDPIKKYRTHNFNTNSMMPSVKSRLIKNIGRTKEKILQGIGKTDRTSDENFDTYVHNFESQHAQANKLNKELNKYLHCLRETQKSSKVFYDTLRETYESEWPMSHLFSEQIESIEIKWADYLAKLHKDVQLPLISYLNEFPEHKKKIEKRCNRLLDYDNARHNLENAQIKTSKKNSQNSQTMSNNNNNNNNSGSSSSSTSSNSNHQTSTDQLTKLTKLKIDLEDKQHIYEDLNQTLCLALPVLYENRIKFYSSIFQTFFHTETTFHSDCVEAKSKLDDICEQLSITTSQRRIESPEFINEANTIIPRNLPPIDGEYSSDIDNDENNYNSPDEEDESNQENSNKENSNKISEFVPKANLDENEAFSKSNGQNTSMIYNYLVNQISQNQEEVAKQRNYTEKYLYKVKATYAYDGKEIDELAFNKDDVIIVVDGTESEKEDLDEGWLIGIHELTNKRGLFPENFTKRI
ncbi:unnamed protein product [Brachionus calyciflorus]|uniref:SH3 domain-containing protein n=1 Tax=Brachionus calyciflorus TaxID=104777 RepID=A0A813W2A8_9BILA|nr:unnamed protein product [Brachionus calyciflorus]